MRSKVIPIFIIAISFVFAINPHLIGAMFGNESCTAFPNQCDSGSGGGDSDGLYKPQSTVTIGQLVIEGGTYFLKSSRDMDQFLSLVEFSEMSGPDYLSLKTAIDAAIKNMEEAQKAYLRLIILAACTTYNQEIISRLIEFDFSTFQNNNGLIPSIFEKVEMFLSCGNVRGVYKEFYFSTFRILEELRTIKKDVDSNILPDISTLWRINQTFSEVKLFGQYVAEVFYSIK